MLNSNNIQSVFSSSQDHPFALIYSNDQTPNTSNQNQESPSLVLSSNFNTIIDEHQFPLSNILSPMQATIIHGDGVDDQENSNNHKPINQMENPCHVKTIKRRTHATPSSRRKRGKKSTHSKISTAQGVRDRRMRLSLPIARKFFDLQDLLGVDKASKTIEWLFSNSQEAIKELERKNHSQGKENSVGKFMSDFEVKSGNNEVEENPNNENGIAKSRKFMFNYSHAKQCRERARARARERTREKMKIKDIIEQWYDEPNNSKDNDDLEHSGYFCPFEDHSSSYSQYSGVSPGKDHSNSTTVFMGLLGNLDTCTNSVISTMGLVTSSNPVSSCSLPTRKFPFLLE